DVMTYYAFKISGFERNRVFGQAGVLDGARFVYFISKEINIDINSIKTLVLGGHGNTMLPLIRYTTINSVPVDYFLNKEILEKIIECTRKGGEEIISLLKTGSAYIAPSASCLYMIEAIVKDKKTLCTASVYLNGEYGLKDVCIGVPVKIGKNGIEEIIELSLNEEEKKALYLSASIYKESIKELPF
ncbi:MAG: malate dehydrogenase, partial [Candidatus Aenigmatarchaeota archaeon]